MNLSALRTQFLGLLNRNDCSNDLADTFIGQAQTRIQRTLRVPGMEKTQIYTAPDVGADTLIIPPDFLSIKYLYCGNVLLKYKDLGHFLRYPQQVGIPEIYTRIQASILVKPEPPVGTTTLMVYYAAQADLESDTDENFFSVVMADLLIYAALSYAADYFVDDRAPAFESRYTQIYGDIEEQNRLVEMDQSAMNVAPAYDMEY